MQHSPSVKDHHSESYIIMLQLLSAESHDSTLNHQKRKNKLVLMNVSLRPLIGQIVSTDPFKVFTAPD